MRTTTTHNVPAKRALFSPLRLAQAVALISLLAMAACASPTRLATPDGFVELADGFGVHNATYKAVSADGAVLLVRRQEDVPAGSLEFWTEALSGELIDGRGYELLSQEEVRSADGTAGSLLHLRGSLDDQLYRYELAVFLRADNIVTVEASTPDELYETHAEALHAAIVSVNLK